MSAQPYELANLGRCGNCAIRHKAICSVLTTDELHRISQIAHQRHIPAGQIIMSDQEPVSYFANIISGVVKLTKTLDDGRQQIVGLLFPPDFIGRTYSELSPYNAEAATDTSICCFPHSSFERLLDDVPDLEHRLFERTLDELDSARDWMVLLGRKSAVEKVGSFLLQIARRTDLVGCPHIDRPDLPVFKLPLTRADMADYLGLTIETVSRQMTKLKSGKIIRIDENTTISVLDMEALSDLSGEDPSELL